MHAHENKPQPASIPYTKIVAAYGHRECPKLVEQAAGENLEVRINALAVLCEEFNNPYKIFGCAQSGAIKVLSCMVIDPDYTTRERASKALSIAARDACGLTAILDDDAVVDMLNGINDPSEVVRSNVYECIYQVTRTAAGVEACVRAGVTHAFVTAVQKDIDPLKPVLLKAIHNIIVNEQGMEEALASGAVRVCISLLSSPHAETLIHAARTLGFLCSHEDAKTEALDGGAVALLVALFSVTAATVGEKNQIEIKATVAMALMAITSTDEGKRQMYTYDGARPVIHLLYETDRLVRLTALKVIANIAVHPAIRETLLTDRGANEILRKMMKSDDELMAKHSKKALDAVNWTP